MGRVSPVRASSPTIANEPGRSNGDLPAAQQQPQGDRQVEAAGVLLEVGRGQVDHDAVDRPAESRVDDRPLDPVRALADRGLGQAHQHRLGRRRERDVDLDFHGGGVDPDERVRGELREHGRLIRAGSDFDRGRCAIGPPEDPRADRTESTMG